jgi:hypothetical protein
MRRGSGEKRGFAEGMDDQITIEFLVICLETMCHIPTTLHMDRQNLHRGRTGKLKGAYFNMASVRIHQRLKIDMSVVHIIDNAASITASATLCRGVSKMSDARFL